MEAVSASAQNYISMSDPKEGETLLVSERHKIIKRRSKSFCGSPSSSSSSSLGSFSSSLIDSPLSPVTPLQFSGVPFKWEMQPGIPKQHITTPKYKTPGRDLLPLPPAGASSSTQRFINVWPKKKKKKTHLMIQRDPFVAALVECSKPTEDEEEECWKSSTSTSLSSTSSRSVTKVSRTLSDRFGFVDLYGSCKTSCSVLESKVLIPRPGRSSYDMLNRRIG